MVIIKQLDDHVKYINLVGMITVFYDGKCGLCSKEILYYQSIAPEGTFVWDDVTQPNSQHKTLGISLAESLKILHAQDADGICHKGVDAFILMWRHLGKWRWLARIVALPGIYQLAGGMYRIFAERRFKRLSHCQLALRQDD